MAYCGAVPALRRLAILLLAVAGFAAGATSASAAYPPPNVTITGVSGEPTPSAKGLTIDWTSGDGTPAALYRKVGAAPYEMVGFYGAYGHHELTDVAGDAPQEFEVRQIGNTPKVLAHVSLAGGQETGRRISLPIPPRDTPHWVDRLLQIAPWVILLTFGVLLLLFVRSIWGRRQARRWGPRILAIVLTAVTVISVTSKQPLPMPQQPVADAQEYADSAQKLADGKGFVDTWYGARPQPPRYSPGYPLALAPFAALKQFPQGVQQGASAAAVVYVLAVVWAAWALGGAVAASFAAGLILISPFARQSGALIMSDALGAALAVMVVPLIAAGTKAGHRMAGALLGFAATVRILAGVGILAALASIPRASWRTLVLWAAPFVVGLFLLQWLMFGNPLYTGYDRWNAGFSEMFALTNPFKGAAQEGLWMYNEPWTTHLIDVMAPAGAQPATGAQNWVFYPAVLLGIVWIYMPPLVSIVGLAYGWRHRTDPAVRYALLTMIGTVVIYCFYQYQAARMVAAPASLLLVLTACGFARAIEWFQRLEVVWREREQRLAETAPTGAAADPA